MADPDFTWTSVLVDISGADPRVADQIQRNALIGAQDLTVIPATEILGESTRTALAAGSTWLRESTPPSK